jgi:succinate dehydrogenase / fumarate reductase cytochrome b subunit
MANRVSGVVTTVGAVGLVLWLLAAAAGPDTYIYVHRVLSSLPGQIGLLLFQFAFFFHLCGGIRHLIWDAVYGFELSSIYESGWVVVGASIALTAATWVAGLFAAPG